MKLIVVFCQLLNHPVKYRNLSLFLLILTGCSQNHSLLMPTLPFNSSLNTPSNEEMPRLSYDGHYLVFASDRQGKRGIWLYDLQERKMLPLIGLNQPNSRQDEPDVSSDGRYIVYLSEQFGKTDIVLYDRENHKIENLTANLAFPVSHPTISGNGRFIVYQINRSGQWDLVVYDRGQG